MVTKIRSIRNNNPISITDEINDIIHHEMRPSENIRFAYTIMNKQNLDPPIIYSTYPKEWIDKYLSMDLYKHDPVVTVALRRIMPFIWGEEFQSVKSTSQNNIFLIAKEFNIFNGFAFPLHDHENNLATLSLYTEGDNETFQVFIEDNKKYLHELLLSIHENFIIEQRHNHDVLRHKYEKKLTSREIETLQWASVGKTYSEIAIIMGITESTVKFHIGNVIAKLEVVNAKHAIKKASDLRLFTFYE